MLKLDNNLLDELGLGSLPEDQKKAMLQHIYETLELRVGTNLANQMTDQQLEEFEKFIDEGGDANQAQALQWLETNLPNYKEVVNEVFEDLKREVVSMSAQIMATVPSANDGVVNAAAPSVQPPSQQSSYQQPAYQPTVTPQSASAYQAGQPYVASQQSPVQPNGHTQQQPYAPQQQSVPPSDMTQPQQPQYVQQPPVQNVYGPTPMSPQPPQQPQPSAPQSYQYPQQQPPAGPGNYQPPQYQ